MSLVNATTTSSRGIRLRSQNYNSNNNNDGRDHGNRMKSNRSSTDCVCDLRIVCCRKGSIHDVVFVELDNDREQVNRCSVGSRTDWVVTTRPVIRIPMTTMDRVHRHRASHRTMERPLHWENRLYENLLQSNCKTVLPRIPLPNETGGQFNSYIHAKKGNFYNNSECT